MRNIIIIGLLLLLTQSCRRFLSDYPNDLAYPTQVKDFDELLVGEGYMSPSDGNDIKAWFHLMDDDTRYVSVGRTAAESRARSAAYHWWDPVLDTKATWDALYKHIMVTNVVLSGLDDFKSGPADLYRKVKGEAHFLRAANYFFLTNLYGKPYNEGTAARDLGVTLKLDPGVQGKRFTRNTVAECYTQMVSDLKEAVWYLKGLTPSTKFRASEMSSRLLLSRVYLYMGGENNWKEAVKQCDTILLQGGYQLRDLNGLDPFVVSPLSISSPETIFSNGRNYYANSLGEPYFSLNFAPAPNSYYRPTEEMLLLYVSNDLRRTCYYRDITKGSSYDFTPAKINVMYDGSDFFMLRLSEVYLNKAEAHAALGEDADAIAALSVLRARRFSGTVPDLGNPTGADLMSVVRDERRRELSFEGHRWFDLRRYAVHPLYPYQREIRHPFYTELGLAGEIVLKKYDEDAPYYILPIPESEVVANGGSLVQNEKRVQKQPE